MPAYSETEYYTAQQGETPDVVCYDLYGDEFLVDDLIELNPQVSGCLYFSGGEELRVPVYDEDTDEDSVAPWRRAT